jgi:hypothetical protein
MGSDYLACGSAAWEALSLRQAFDGVLSAHFSVVGPWTVFCDIKAALTLCKDCKEGQRVTHIDVIHHCVSGHVATGELELLYCPPADVRDCLTKTFPRSLSKVNLFGLGMLLGSHLLACGQQESVGVWLF